MTDSSLKQYNVHVVAGLTHATKKVLQIQAHAINVWWPHLIALFIGNVTTTTTIFWCVSNFVMRHVAQFEADECLRLKGFQFTRYLQDLNSPPFSIYSIAVTWSRQPPFFQFTWYLEDLSSPLRPFSIYTVFTGSQQPPFFNLHGIYRISTASLFQFTRYLQDLNSLSFSIYTVFTGSRQPPLFNLRGIYRISTALLFQFTQYLQDLDNPPFFNLRIIYSLH